MPHQTDLLLVRPSDKKQIYGSLGRKLSAIEPPLWGVLIAAFVRDQGFKVKVLDMEVENMGTDELVQKVQEENPLLTGFILTGNHLSASTWMMPAARRVLTALRNHSTSFKTFLWGLHPSALPERTLNEEDTDFVVQGEGFFTITELLRTLKSGGTGQLPDIAGLWQRINGKIVGNPRAPLIESLNSLPVPAWDLIPARRYRAHNWQCFEDPDSRSPYGVIYTSLGCPFSCKFCSLSTFLDTRKVRFRNPHNIGKELDLLVKEYGVRNLKILDECFVLNEKHVSGVCDLFIQRSYDLNIWAYARIESVNRPLLQKLRKAGVNWLCYGIESGNNKVRNSIGKTGFDRAKIDEAIQMTKEAGIHIIANYMFGLPDDNLKTMQETLDMAIELNCEYANFYATMAWPGSELYRESVSNGTPLPSSWRGYSQFDREALPLPTKYLTGPSVLGFRDSAFVKYHKNPRYLQMIREKFGERIVDHIKGLLTLKLERKYTGCQNG